MHRRGLSRGWFLTQDTYRGSVWQPWTQNLYVYVGNNPVNYVDPTGHRPIMIDSGGGGGSVEKVIEEAESSGLLPSDPIKVELEDGTEVRLYDNDTAVVLKGDGNIASQYSVHPQSDFRVIVGNVVRYGLDGTIGEVLAPLGGASHIGKITSAGFSGYGFDYTIGAQLGVPEFGQVDVVVREMVSFKPDDLNGVTCKYEGRKRVFKFFPGGSFSSGPWEREGYWQDCRR